MKGRLTDVHGAPNAGPVSQIGWIVTPAAVCTNRLSWRAPVMKLCVYAYGPPGASKVRTVVAPVGSTAPGARRSGVPSVPMKAAKKPSKRCTVPEAMSYVPIASLGSGSVNTCVAGPVTNDDAFSSGDSHAPRRARIVCSQTGQYATWWWRMRQSAKGRKIPSWWWSAPSNRPMSWAVTPGASGSDASESGGEFGSSSWPSPAPESSG
jgi:hypothetical protein